MDNASHLNRYVTQIMTASSKYQPLYEHLIHHEQNEVAFTFSEIEALLGERLPASARTQRMWWGNRRRGAVQSQSWMKAGYHVEELDLVNQQVTFRKPLRIYEVNRIGDTVLWDADLIKAFRQQMDWSQSELADQLNMRQQTISEWETGLYAPTRSTSKLLTLVAEQAGFKYGSDSRKTDE